VPPVLRGRLSFAADGPARGERATELARMGNVVVEQILSGQLDGPVDYRQDQDEWVVVLEGGAVLEVGGERLDLGPGDWVVLPAGVPHRLVETTPGTSWLAVHVHPEG
jgi:mannose-6-phosphate isomerase-like protein (cupin superfamily)